MSPGDSHDPDGHDPGRGISGAHVHFALTDHGRGWS